ncbi:hypothetical protein DFJ74DRAFT_758544 [Hyaloraphidium curvatum]|nr:hypothetical protein DFJ74DRAFT_758544 [Hyaloraphidium curvatum]
MASCAFCAGGRSAARYLEDRRAALGAAGRAVAAPGGREADADGPTLLPFGNADDRGAFAAALSQLLPAGAAGAGPPDAGSAVDAALRAVHAVRDWLPAGDAAAVGLRLRLWAAAEFYPVYDVPDVASTFHTPLWAKDVADDAFVARCRRARVWDERTYARVAAAFPHAAPDPAEELRREASTAAAEAKGRAVPRGHPLRTALDAVASLPPADRVASCLVGRLVSLLQESRMPSLEEQQREAHADARTLSNDKAPAQNGFAQRGLPAEAAQRLASVCCAVTRAIAACIARNRAAPAALYDGLGTAATLLRTFPSYPLCAGFVAALADPDFVSALAASACDESAPAPHALAALDLLAKLVPDLCKLDGITLPDFSTVRSATERAVRAALLPRACALASRAASLGPGAARTAAADLAAVLTAIGAADVAWDAAESLRSSPLLPPSDAALAARPLEGRDASPALLAPRASRIGRAGAPCACASAARDPRRSAVCHACADPRPPIGPKGGPRRALGMLVAPGPPRSWRAVHDPAEASRLWLAELSASVPGDDPAIERAWRDCMRRLAEDDAFRAAPGVPRAVREAAEGKGGQGDAVVEEETAVAIGRLIGNVEIAEGA